MDAARDTLGAAAVAARQLPGAPGETVLLVAREAFVDGMQAVAAVSLVVAAALSLFALRVLGHLGPTGDEVAQSAAQEVPSSTGRPTWEGRGAAEAAQGR